MNRKHIAGSVVLGVVLSGWMGLPVPESLTEGNVSAVLSVTQAQAASAQASVSEKGIPAGMEEAYRLGMNPLESEVPVMYTIHPCPHCVHLKDFLDRNGVKYVQVYVDDFADPARQELMNKLQSYNPRSSFPTLVTPEGRFVVGFRETAVKRLLGIN